MVVAQGTIQVAAPDNVEYVYTADYSHSCPAYSQGINNTNSQD